MRKNKKYVILLLVFVLIICLYNIRLSYKNMYTKDEDITTITIWNIQGWLTDSLHEVLRSYEEEYPNVKFVVKDYENQVYKEIVKDILVTNEGPDIFFTWGFEFLREFVDGGIVLDITDEVNDWKYDELIGDERLEHFSFDNKIYGLPVQGFNTVLYVNEDIFNRYDIEIPNNYNELLVASDKLIANGITPISIGGGENWVLSLLYMNLAIRESGIEEINEMFKSKEYLKGEGFVEAANKFVELVDKEILGNDLINKSVNEAVYEFCNEKSAMFFGGSFDLNTIKVVNGDLTNKIKIMPFPATNNTSNLNEGVAGYTDFFAINKYTENKELVVEIYMRLVKDLSEKLIHEKYAGIPVFCNENCEFNEDELIYECMKIFPEEGYHEPYDIVLPAEFADVHLNALEELANEEITVEEFINRQREYK